jgi:hypothetical protein
MGVVLAMDDPANYGLALRRIRGLWRNGFFTILPHAQQRMLEGKFDTTDIQHLIFSGRVIDHSHPGENWRYVIGGKTVDDRKCKCVVEMERRLLIVSIYNIGRR